ncbi:MAG: hypothetical protein ACQESR_27560, partial [Planctomycetota bacterium]
HHSVTFPGSIRTLTEEGVALRHLLRVLVSNTRHLPTHALTIHQRCSRCRDRPEDGSTDPRMKKRKTPRGFFHA